MIRLALPGPQVVGNGTGAGTAFARQLTAQRMLFSIRLGIGGKQAMLKMIVRTTGVAAALLFAVGALPSTNRALGVEIGTSAAEARDNVVRQGLRYTFKHSRGVSYRRAQRAPRYRAPRYRAPRYRAPRYRY